MGPCVVNAIQRGKVPPRAVQLVLSLGASLCAVWGGLAGSRLQGYSRLYHGMLIDVRDILPKFQGKMVCVMVMLGFGFRASCSMEMRSDSGAPMQEQSSRFTCCWCDPGHLGFRRRRR